MDVLNPTIIGNVFDKNFYNKLCTRLKTIAKNGNYDTGFGRYTLGGDYEPLIQEALINVLPIARGVFKSETLLPSYAFFSHYEMLDEIIPSLFKHKDDNACTYTIDFCLYQTEPWDIYVEEKPYTLQTNQALAMYGNEQLHWREEFPNPKEQSVGMIFFHFVEPDHWYYAKGPDYINVIQGRLTEEQWVLSQMN